MSGSFGEKAAGWWNDPLGSSIAAISGCGIDEIDEGRLAFHRKMEGGPYEHNKKDEFVLHPKFGQEDWAEILGTQKGTS